LHITKIRRRVMQLSNASKEIAKMAARKVMKRSDAFI